MKITIRLSLLLLIMLTAFSCNELDELTEFDIREDFSTSFNIDVADNEGGMADTFMDSSTIDLASNQDIQDNLDVLQDVTLNTLTYEISDFTGAEGAVITEASLILGNVTIAVANINLQESDDNNTIYELGDSSQLNAIANALQSNTAITTTISGTVNATPVTFNVKVNLDVTVTIDVL